MLQALQGHKVFRELREILGTQALLVQLGRKVRLEIQALKGLKVYKAFKDLKVLKAVLRLLLMLLVYRLH